MDKVKLVISSDIVAFPAFDCLFNEEPPEGVTVELATDTSTVVTGPLHVIKALLDDLAMDDPDLAEELRNSLTSV